MKILHYNNNEPVREKQFGFRPGPIDTDQTVQSQKMDRGWNFGFRKYRNGNIHVAKIKALISYCEADLHLCFRLC